MAEPIRVLITGAAGQIAYSLIPMISKGDVFGPNQPVILHLLDIQPMMEVLNGVVMEIEDCSFPLVQKVVATDDLQKAYDNIDAAFMLGALPRKQGMERKDLLGGNVKIFKAQALALDKYAKKDVKVLVVGNPANTNAFVLSKYAPSIPKENITAMTRLDHHRMIGMVANRVGVPCSQVKNVIVWGNHSSTQFPDLKFATVEKGGSSVPACKAINDDSWVQGDYIKSVQQRGAAVINARKMSSAMSAARAAAEHVRNIFQGTPEGEYVSMAVPSDGSYGIQKDLWFSFPVTIKNRKYQIVQGLNIDDFQREKLSITEKELTEEKNDAMDAVQ